MKFLLLLLIVVAGIGCLSMGANTSNVASASPQMDKKMETEATAEDYYSQLPKGFEQPTDDSGRLLLREYGAVFVARGGAVPPKKVVFRDEADVMAFQESVKRSSQVIVGTKLELQTAAMDALRAAIAEAAAAGLSIGPRGSDSARRGYDQTVGLWASRVNPGFTYWVGKGKVAQAEANRIKALSPYEQVPEILKLEQQGIFFARTLDKSIIYSVAPPGTSQHISMLAFDVKEFDNPDVRAILAKYGWFQTVSSDLPHFTYLGVQEKDLPGLGLKKVMNSGRPFWIPAI